MFLVRKTQLFAEVPVGAFFAWGGHLCRKVSAERFTIELSHKWVPGEGRVVHRQYKGTKLRYDRRHFVYGSDLHAFLPYIRGKAA